MNVLIKAGIALPYQIIETTNKHSYFKFKEGYLEIHLSKSMQLNDLLKKLEANIVSYYQKIKPVPANKFLLWGEKYNLVLKEGLFNYQIKENNIFITSAINEDYRALVYQDALKNYLKAIETDVKQTLFKYDINPVPIKLKKLKSKYGSYHRGKNYLVLNVLLASLEKEFSYYVLMHEYAHQKVANHQKEFYQLLKKLYPNYLKLDQALKKTVIHF